MLKEPHLDLAIIIPVYNEAKTIEKVLDDVNQELKKSFKDVKYCIYVYDNNSMDDTALRVKYFSKSNKDTEIKLKRSYKQGKGCTIALAFSEIEADCYCMIDGDDTYGVDELRKMYDLVTKEHVDMTIGDRLSTSYFNENKRPFHNTGNKLVKNLINLLYKTNYHDAMSGLRMFSRSFVKEFEISSQGFTLETEMCIWAAIHNKKVAELPVEYRDRPAGSESKLKTIPDGMKVLRKIIKMYVFR